MTLETDAANGAAGSAVADVPATNGNAGTPAPTMDETLRTAYKAAMAKEDGGGDEPALETESSQEGRQRGPDGKFLPAKAKTNGAADPAAAVPAEGAEPAVTEPVAAKPHDSPPNTWRKEIGADFAKLPENVREEIYRRENDFHKGIGQYKEAAEFGTAMAQELQPYGQVMQQYGVNARDVVKSLAASWNMLVTGSPQQKANLVLQLVKDHGIDLASLSTPPQDQAQPTQEDPRLATALQRLEKLEGHLTLQERQRAEAEYSGHVNSVNAFGSDPKNKHFAAVREDMAALIESGRAKDLPDAYDKAIWINPEVRKLLLAEQNKAQADKAAIEAAAARKAAGANVTRRGTPPVSQKTGSIEDTIKARYRELTS